MSYALVLGDQLAELYPDSQFSIYLADKKVGLDEENIPYRIVEMQTLGIIDVEGMIKRYNISELNTAIKPYCILDLFDKYPEDSVIYFDPDIYPVSRLLEVENAFSKGAKIVMTPHILSPLEVGRFKENNFLTMGIYNLGFLGIAPSEETEELMRWWGRKLENQCTIDIPNGLFVDQKWASFFPSFIDETFILRSPGYNVAYWNLHNRSVMKSGDGYQVNGQALRFCHFSGVDIKEKNLLSRHYTFFNVHNTGAYGDLITEYRQKVTDRDYDLYQLQLFSFFFSPTGEKNLHAVKNQTSYNDSQTVASKSIFNFLHLEQFYSHDEYVDWKTKNKKEIERERNEELALMRNSGDIISFKGYDYIFAQETFFDSSYLYSYDSDAQGNPIPNWREHVTSRSSNYQNRIRASIHIFFQEFVPKLDSDIYITEQKTMLFDWLKVRFPKIIGSEFMGHEYDPGQQVDGLRHENVEELSFFDNQFDYILSFDVFEHVPYYIKALKEVYRCLKPGGYFIFSIPPNNMDEYDNVTRAVLNEDLTITHYTEPEYHGNPVDLENGSLCFRYYGWQLFDEMKKIGFKQTFIYRYWAKRFGYLGPDQILFVARK